MTTENAPAAPKRDGVAIIVYQSTFDIAMMPMIIAQGALSMGMEVSIYYTFFGLSSLKKSFKPKMPGIWRLFTGMMVRKMGQQSIPTFSQMLKDNIEMGAKVYACSTSMTMMGVRKEDLVDGVEIAGVAKFLDMAANAGTTLAIG
jgi:peroxiredoxin family protein